MDKTLNWDITFKSNFLLPLLCHKSQKLCERPSPHFFPLFEVRKMKMCCDFKYLSASLAAAAYCVSKALNQCL